MNARTFEAMARHAASLSRRGSLRVLGGAALTGAIAAPTAAVAGKAGNKAQKRCKRQLGQCLASVEAFCEPQQLPAVCEAFLNPCCEHFSRCEAGQGIACLFAGIAG
jgi:hypothetical protein